MGSRFLPFHSFSECENIEVDFDGGGIGGDEFSTFQIIGIWPDTTLQVYLLTPDQDHDVQQTVVNDGFDEVVIIISGADSAFGGEDYSLNVTSYMGDCVWITDAVVIQDGDST